MYSESQTFVKGKIEVVDASNPLPRARRVAGQVLSEVGPDLELQRNTAPSPPPPPLTLPSARSIAVPAPSVDATRPSRATRAGNQTSAGGSAGHAPGGEPSDDAKTKLATKQFEVSRRMSDRRWLYHDPHCGFSSASLRAATAHAADH